jgi:hypothetical protein
MKTTKLRWSTDVEGTWISALVSRDEAMQTMQNVEEGRTYEVTVKKARKKRSLDSNAYAWVLMDKLAAYYKVPVTEVYRNFVREIGGNSEIICMMDGAVKTFCEGWEHNGIGWQTEVLPSKIEGCSNVKIYYGSSTYDTEQMSRLIEMVVDECKDAGIETLTPEELARMMQNWR